MTEQNIINVYTDGACKNNQNNAKYAGIGVYFSDNDPRNISEPLVGLIKTNNRAELMAIIRAIEQIIKNPPILSKTIVILHTDSKYAYNCATTWIHKWKQNNWKKSINKIKNIDLIQRLDQLLESTKIIRFNHVYGHSGIIGNEKADKLANLGCTVGYRQPCFL